MGNSSQLKNMKNKPLNSKRESKNYNRPRIETRGEESNSADISGLERPLAAEIIIPKLRPGIENKLIIQKRLNIEVRLLNTNRKP